MLYIIKDMNEQLIKKCISCNEEKETSNFYKVNEFYFQSKCKICFNRDRIKYPVKKYYNYKKKPTGIDKLGEEKKEIVKNDILGGKLTYKDICGKHDIKYQTLISWIKKGQLPKRETIKEKIRKIKKEKCKLKN